MLASEHHANPAIWPGPHSPCGRYHRCPVMSIFLPIYNGRKDMSNSPNLLGELSRATANRAAAAQAMLAAIRTADGRHLTGTLWRGDLLATSEQALPKADEYQVVVPDRSTVAAQPAGRAEAGHLIAHGEVSHRILISKARCALARRGRGEGLGAPQERDHQCIRPCHVWTAPADQGLFCCDAMIVGAVMSSACRCGS
jgi:hypothetical protein